MSKDIEEIARLREAFWSKVDRRGAGDCWRWTGSHSGQGYGMFYRRGRYWAHRLALELSGTEIPPGMVVDHICRVRDCVNPQHLRVVTPKVNSLENSVSIPAINHAKTYCRRGHELSAENVRLRKRHNITERVCRLCHRVNGLEHMRQKRGMPGLSERAARPRKIMPRKALNNESKPVENGHG